VQLDELMTDVSALVAGSCRGRRRPAAVEGESGALHADARLLKEAIVNVVCNAIEATPRGGHVTVRYHSNDAVLSIVITEHGSRHDQGDRGAG